MALRFPASSSNNLTHHGPPVFGPSAHTSQSFLPCGRQCRRGPPLAHQLATENQNGNEPHAGRDPSLVTHSKRPKDGCGTYSPDPRGPSV
jgi:hypothetical protein